MHSSESKPSLFSMYYEFFIVLTKALLMQTVVRSVSLLVLGWCTISTAADLPKFEPKQDTLPVKPPAGAVVLYDGNKTNEFLKKDGQALNWKIENGELISSRDKNRANHVVSRIHFRDADIHVEFNVSPVAQGNSGIYIHGNYEMQIMNSHGKKELTEQEAGSLYGFQKPLVNATRPAGEWQVYDIRYIAPRRNGEGKITEEGTITAWLNGQKVQDGTRFGEPRSVYHPYIYQTTPYLQKIWAKQKATSVGPVFLQDHDSPCRFRNVWILPLDEHAGAYEEK
jgi:Domain of Unknown Function (DUF1080)